MTARPDHRLRVVVADDSELVCEVLAHLLGGEHGFEVVATAHDGAAAAAAVEALRPDAVTMDLQMPGTDGFGGIARIMAATPTPILVLTGRPEEAVGFRALALGALDLLEKPAAGGDLAAYGARLRSRLRLIAGVRVIRHPRGLRGAAAVLPPRPAARCELVVVGASLGGPRALAALLQGLPPAFPLPVAVVQHIADGFAEGLAAWLAHEAGRPVRVARDGDALAPGVVLLAPSGHHLEVGPGRVHLSGAPPIDTFRPSVEPLFRSAARAYGRSACGVILTGMGHDGAEALKELRAAGGITLAQDEATSVVFGMPRAALEAGAVDRVLPLDAIARTLAGLAR
ncbi:chemotaxis-specific protein-glutamate methyltransferase CheB [Anaeromyxobacter diazotrophicus]|uniref:chemotaxis-specific protein-glutamate methyltransferase CheB n=1 Tax=Anaeromyxobacter diazotrophicus TaxID=2590199 RepID=UPI0015914839|nr:chemotaxis-specific protein-glutamate methyltransferase CheB [Anaeromyxobacter diazotrophicus]